jgi:hypothetical protein
MDLNCPIDPRPTTLKSSNAFTRPPCIVQWCYSIFSSIEEAKTCANRGGLDLKFEAIEEMLCFLLPKKGHICADLSCQLIILTRKVKVQKYIFLDFF